MRGYRRLAWRILLVVYLAVCGTVGVAVGRALTEMLK